MTTTPETPEAGPVEIVKEGNIKITPEVMMSGGGSPIDALAGTMLRQKAEAKTEGKAVK